MDRASMLLIHSSFFRQLLAHAVIQSPGLPPLNLGLIIIIVGKSVSKLKGISDAADCKASLISHANQA